MWSRSCRRTSIPYRVILALPVIALLRVGLTQPLPDYHKEGEWQRVCELAQQQPLAIAPPAGPLSEQQLTACDETALYYGIGAKPDYAAALQCGWFHRAHEQRTLANMFYGPGVLTMLYANGKGVRRNYDLAIRFACEQGWASEAEMEYRIGHLQHLRDTKAESGTFDLCDDITSGLSQGICTSIQTRTADVSRSRKIDEIVDGLTVPAKGAFPPLQAAESAFEAARIEQEVDLSGTARGAFALEEEARLRDQFLVNLQRFGRGGIPSASDADLSLLEQKLNTIYKRIQNSPSSKWEFGTIKPEGIRDTERKWISLADAWIAFGRIAYPDLSATRIRAQLIRLRLQQLRSLYSE